MWEVGAERSEKKEQKTDIKPRIYTSVLILPDV